MMHMELHANSNTLLMRLDGRFVEPFAQEARSLLARCKYRYRLVVDLSELTFIDTLGETVLSWMALLGAYFVADSQYSSKVCQRLHLPLTNREDK